MRLKTNPRFAGLAPGAILPPAKKSKPSRKAKVPESDLQAMAENLCLALGVRFFRIPDKLMGFLAHYAPAWVRVFVSRYIAGVPDMLLFRQGENGLNHCKMVEIKTEAGKLSQTQRKWFSGLNVHVCYGWDETEKAIREFAEGQ